MPNRIPLLALALAVTLAPLPSPWTLTSTGSTASLRGLSVVSPDVVWASGTRGTFLRTTDGGQHWAAGQVAGYDRVDFRDVKAFDASTAYLLGIAAGGGIFKTEDAGAHWTRQYFNPDPGFFLDCMAFWDQRHGVAVGDPIDGHFLLLRTSDGGAHWLPALQADAAQPGEGAFAASGTTLVTVGKSEAWFATGGPSGARVFHTRDSGRTWTAVPTPMAITGVGGTAAAGIFSLAFRDARHGVAVGGDYQKPTLAERTAAVTADGGKTWQLASPGPGGYRSGAAFRPGCGGRVLVAVGTSGSDESSDGGHAWRSLDATGFNTIAFAANGTAFAAGDRGRIATATLPCAATR